MCSAPYPQMGSKRHTSGAGVCQGFAAAGFGALAASKGDGWKQALTY